MSYVLFTQPRGSPTDQWQEYGNGDGFEYLTYANSGGNANGLIITMPQSLDRYEYQVRTKNTCRYSEEQFYSDIGYTPVGLVRDLSADVASATCELIIQWSPPEDTGNYSYEIEIFPQNSNSNVGISITNTPACTNANGNKCILSRSELNSYGHFDNLDLRVQVRATDIVNSRTSSWNSILKSRLVVGQEPPTLAAPAVAGTTVTWSGTPSASTYYVEDSLGRQVCQIPSTTFTTSCSLDGNALNNFNNFANNSNLLYRVRAENGCGTG